MDKFHQCAGVDDYTGAVDKFKDLDFAQTSGLSIEQYLLVHSNRTFSAHPFSHPRAGRDSIERLLDPFLGFSNLGQDLETLKNLIHIDLYNAAIAMLQYCSRFQKPS